MANERPVTFAVEVFHDGACPLCAREMRWLRRLDRHGRIQFTDIADPAFDPASVGRTFEALMARIHGRLPDGRIIEGVEVFRQLYAAAGFPRLAAFTRLPVVAQLLDAGYWLFAKNRLRLTGRCLDGQCSVHGPAAVRARRTAAAEGG